ncbi:MAG: hypothetical protein ACI4W1_04220 [Ruminococcus sp.]
MKNKKKQRNKSQNVSEVNQDTIKFQNKDLEIDNILEETHFLTEKDQMEETAKKYRARPKMDEIFSNTSKEVRYKNKNPLDIDDEEDSKDKNALVDEDAATTMQAQILMDNPHSTMPQVKKEEETKTKTEDKESAENAGAEQEKEEELVTLQPEYTENTKFSDEVFDDVEDLHIRNVTVTDFESIDIDLDLDKKQKEQAIEYFSENNEKKDGENGTDNDKSKKDKTRNPEQLKEEIKGNYEKLFGIKKPKTHVVISKVPVYQREKDVDKVHIKAGKFSSVVREEYEMYLKSNDPAISQVIKKEGTAETQEEPKKKVDLHTIGEKVSNAVVGFFSSEEEQISQEVPPEKIETVEDYTSKEDAKSILAELNLNIKKLFMRSLAMIIISLFAVVITVVVRVFTQQICSAIANAPIVYAVINVFLLALAIVINRVTIVSGLTPLVKFKGNSDTALAVAAIAAGLQAAVNFFFIIGTETFTVSYFSVIVILGFLANTLGKLFMVLRVKDNFKFVSSHAPAYAAKIYTNEDVASKMMSGTVFERPLVAYQHKTSFLSNFLKISYTPDPSEELAGKFAPFTTIISLIVAVIYGCVYTSFDGAINALAVMTAVSVPLATLLAVNVPLRGLCKKLLSKNAMVSSYPSVKQFCDSTGVIADARELYPEGRVTLDGIKTFIDHGADEALIACAAILKEAESPMSTIFDKAIDKGRGLPEVESFLYEDTMGLVGWVNSERILIGSRELMEKYNIDTPSADYEEKYRMEGKEITYLSKAGELAAMFVLKYSADPEIAAELQRAEENGVSILVRTTDCNITAERIAEDFGIFYRSVKVLPTGLGNVGKELQEQTEESSRAYLATRGSFVSLIRGISGCVRLNGNISLSVMIQLISVILGVLLCTLLCLYAGVQVLGTVEILIYSVFWAVAAIVAPLIKKP